MSTFYAGLLRVRSDETFVFEPPVPVQTHARLAAVIRDQHRALYSAALGTIRLCQAVRGDTSPPARPDSVNYLVAIRLNAGHATVLLENDTYQERGVSRHLYGGYPARPGENLAAFTDGPASALRRNLPVHAPGAALDDLIDAHLNFRPTFQGTTTLIAGGLADSYDAADEFIPAPRRLLSVPASADLSVPGGPPDTTPSLSVIENPWPAERRAPLGSIGQVPHLVAYASVTPARHVRRDVILPPGATHVRTHLLMVPRDTDLDQRRDPEGYAWMRPAFAAHVTPLDASGAPCAAGWTVIDAAGADDTGEYHPDAPAHFPEDVARALHAWTADLAARHDAARAQAAHPSHRTPAGRSVTMTGSPAAAAAAVA